MNTPLEKVLQALYSTTGYEPKQSGAAWTSRCPAHDDHDPSLNVTEADDRGALHSSLARSHSAHRDSRPVEALRPTRCCNGSARTTRHRRPAEPARRWIVPLNDPAKPAKLLLTPLQAAEALGISPRKLWGMTASHEIPHLRLGRCVRYPVDDLERWIDEQKKGGAQR